MTGMAAPDLASRRRRGPSAAAGGRRPPAGRLTHPERVLWPEAAVTKGELADWLRAAAPRMLPHVAGRALTLVRAPQGLAGPRFVQRHPARVFGPAVQAAPVAGQEKPYLTIRDEAGLLALAQAGVLEIHPTGSTLEDFDRPDRLVLDLDPAEGLGFDAVVAAALDLRARVEALGLAAFCRTTGGKGLHVVVPLTPRAGWAEAKAVARTLCEQAAADSPGRYTTSPVREARKGLIFLDYLRNDRLASAIAALSPRARPAAPVAVPLAWAEVTPALDPAGFTLAAGARERLAAPDPWAEMATAAKPLTAMLRRRLGL
jgi:bifunctional non-homologous end joining protein LigD